jgi:bifunctional DNA-binding transcriptional regulator/antitoxin component of YhaV-PrlF toxin-antitoxin module
MLLSMSKIYVSIQSRGTVALPADVRKRHGLDEAGAQVEVIERADGVIELHPQRPVPSINFLRLSPEDSVQLGEALIREPRAHRRLAKAGRAQHDTVTSPP